MFVYCLGLFSPSWKKGQEAVSWRMNRSSIGAVNGSKSHWIFGLLQQTPFLSSGVRLEVKFLFLISLINERFYEPILHSHIVLLKWSYQLSIWVGKISRTYWELNCPWNYNFSVSVTSYAVASGIHPLNMPSRGRRQYHRLINKKMLIDPSTLENTDPK